MSAEDGTNENMMATGTCAEVNARWCLKFGYDAFGNVWNAEKTGEAHVKGLWPNGPSWFLQNSGTVNNRMKDVFYDNAGNQELWIVSGQGAKAEYDSESRTVRIGPAAGGPPQFDGTKMTQYFYNGEGKRVKGTYGTGADQLETWYVYGLDGEVAAEFARGNVGGDTGRQYLVADPLGSTRLVYDGTQGTVAQRLDYEPFGGEVVRAGVSGYLGAKTPSQKFTGKEREGETGADYFGARWLHAGFGRFLGADTPLVDQQVEDPLSWNLYSYVRNSPLVFVDPTGRACTALNKGSDFCGRAAEYARADARVGDQTRFFAAASAVSRFLANVDMPMANPLFVSSTTHNFLSVTGKELQGLNSAIQSAVEAGSLSGPNIDSQIVHIEQSHVQDMLDNLKATDAGAYEKIISESNHSLNPKSGSATDRAARLFSSDKAYMKVLDQVRKQFGRDLDFSKQGDREAIGNALIKHVRATGGCDVNDNSTSNCRK
jgi:RHS repeat-associated protein